MKASLISLATLLLAQFSALALVDLGQPASRTPYEAYMQPVREVMNGLPNAAPSMDRVQALMHQGRAFRYSYTTPFYPSWPEQTAARRQGDCKDKALWLCSQLQDGNARFVIGKARRGSRMSHAWVMWENEGRWWILDCTMNSRPIPADRVGPNEYVPLFSYGKGSAFRHTGTSDQVAGVAAKRKAPVAARGDRRIASN